MSRPRYLADNDLNDLIVMGFRRRDPAAEFARLRDLGLATSSDPEALDFAAAQNGIVISQRDFTLPSFVSGLQEEAKRVPFMLCR